MAADLTEIRALLASVEGFTPGPWRMSIENGSGIVAGHRHAVVSAKSSTLGWPVVLVEPRSRPVMLAAPTLHAHLTDLVGEVERLRVELEKPVMLAWDGEFTAYRRSIGASARVEQDCGWQFWQRGVMVDCGPETGDAGRHAADLALIAAGYRLQGEVKA